MSGTIRRGGTGDLDQVMVVMERAFDAGFGEAWNRAQCLGILGFTDVWLDVAEEDGGCAGFALSRRTLDEAELLLLAVHPAARQRGVGRALVEAVAAEAARRGAARLMLEMREGNDAARLYSATGFVAIGRRPAYYRGADGAVRDAITLARPLANVGNPLE